MAPFWNGLGYFVQNKIGNSYTVLARENIYDENIAPNLTSSFDRIVSQDGKVVLICNVEEFHDYIDITILRDPEVIAGDWETINADKNRSHKGFGTKIVKILCEYALGRRKYIYLRPSTEGWSYWSKLLNEDLIRHRRSEVLPRKNHSLNLEIDLILDHSRLRKLIASEKPREPKKVR